MLFRNSFYPSSGSDVESGNAYFFKDFAQPREQRPEHWRRWTLVLALASFVIAFSLSGCGSSYTVTAASGVGPFQASTNTVEFGDVAVGQTATSSLTLVNQSSTAISVSSLKITGNQFKVSDSTSLPISVAANSTYSVGVQFTPKTSGDSTGQLTVSSTSKSSPSLKVKLHGNGSSTSSTTTAVLSALSCGQNSITGSGSDACTVTLTSPAANGGLTVSLTSNNSAVSVPKSVAVPAGASSAGFTATVSAVTTAQSATLTASAGGISETYSIGLGANVPGSSGSPALQLSSTSLNFGSVTVNNTSTAQSITLTSSGTAPLTLNSASLSGTGFTISGASFPVTLNPGQTATLTVAFDPPVTGTATGAINISDNASPSTATVSLSGTGLAAAGVQSVLSGLSCASNSVTGSATDACTVTLSAAAGTGGLTVGLGSNNSAVSVPGSVTVPAGSSTTGFTATVSAVTTAQTAALTASVGGTTQTYSIGLGASVPGLKLSTSSLNFGSVALNTSSAPQSVTLTSSGTAPLIINSASVTGAGFTVSGASFPVTLNPGQTATLAVTYAPTATGSLSGSISIGDNASPSSAAISLSGTGQAAAGTLSGLTCSQSSITGSGSDSCTVSLSAAAGTGGLAVTLSSSNSAVTVPGSITVPAGSSSIGFTAAVSAVTTAQTDTLTASAGGITKNYAISLGAAGPVLSVGTSSVSFGTVDLSTPATQSVTLTSSGSAALTISAGTVTGAGFSISGVSFPTTLNPGQAATLYIQFDPTIAGSASGTVTLASNASPSTATIGLSGTGQTVSHTVNLSWNAPTGSTDPVAGYNVYRATGSSSSYQLLNTSVNVPTSYTDTNVQSGSSYSYYVESVDAQGNLSGPSNTYTATIP